MNVKELNEREIYVLLANKQLRRRLRACKTEKKLQELISKQKVFVKRRGEYELITCSSNVFIEDDGRVKVLLPPCWSCSFKNINIFSYNIKER